MDDPSRTPPPTSEPPSSLRLLLLVLEGYAYIALVVAAVIGAPILLVLGLLSRRPFVALVAILIGVPLLLVATAAVRALFFRIPPPAGIPVRPSEAPLLYAEVLSIAQAVRAPQVEHIQMISHFNASAVQLPRAGVFWPRNYLLIGFPLFAILSPEQMRAVIAHELAHLSRAHGRIALLVHRLRVSWARLLGALDSATPTFALLVLRWYAPRLDAHSAALARRHELLVDQLAARVAGSTATAESLISLGVVGPIAEHALWRDIAQDDGPGPFSRAQDDPWPRVADDGAVRLEALLADRPEPGDTHPTLGERLAAIGEPARMPVRPDRTAGEVWLPTHATAIALRLDEQWVATRGPGWERRRDARRNRRQRLEVLDALPTLTLEQLHEKAQLIEALQGTDAALPLYERAADAGYPAAVLAVGRVMLEREDDGGVVLIERAIAADDSLGDEGNRRIAEFLDLSGRVVEANRYEALAQAAATRAMLRTAERSEVSAVDRFVGHGLDQGVLEKIRASLGSIREIQTALLVRKELRHSTGSQLVLAVEGSSAQPALRERLDPEAIVQEKTVVVVLGRRDAPLRQALDAVPDARIYGPR